MLVHNVSHTDLVLSVDAPPLDTEEEQEEIPSIVCVDLAFPPLICIVDAFSPPFTDKNKSLPFQDLNARKRPHGIR